MLVVITVAKGTEGWLGNVKCRAMIGCSECGFA